MSLHLFSSPHAMEINRVGASVRSMLTMIELWRYTIHGSQMIGIARGVSDIMNEYRGWNRVRGNIRSFDVLNFVFLPRQRR